MAGHHATPTHSGAAPGGLFITAALVILFVVLFDLGPIAMMGSAAFLLVYASVNAGHLRIHRETGARPAIIRLSLITCLAMFALLMTTSSPSSPPARGSRSSERWRSAFCSSGCTAAGPDAGSWR